MAVLRFIGLGIVALIVGEIIYMIVEFVVSETLSFTVGVQVWWNVRESTTWGLVPLSCFFAGIWLTWWRALGAPSRQSKSTAMTEQAIDRYLNAQRTVTLTDGRTKIGYLEKDEKDGRSVYHILEVPAPGPTGVGPIGGGLIEDFRAEQIAAIQ